MIINLKVKTLDARTHDFSIDNEITIRSFKEQIAEKTNIAADNQRIIYQGRVLSDEKQVKEYDVDGKVLHVAERPPFSQRGANSRNNDEPRPARTPRAPGAGTLRNSPLFRALDGMLVGTMTIPVNAHAPASTNIAPFTSSSSFCMNRITVARHMIDCANNIAAYLENPEIGLNNSSMDILERGRWTMESTVVEVGVSATEMPRNQNIIDMVQGAVNAALSRTNPVRNYTVLQLPPVYTSDNGPGTGEANEPTNNASGNLRATVNDNAAAVILEDVIDAEDDALNEGATAAVPRVNGSESTRENPTEDPNNRRRTGTVVLADVIDQLRNVQTRLNPFFEQYYNILRNEPVFDENDTSNRESTQRIYDRVSEAYHYLSHAQHAISDLMLDLSQPAPRFLTCRPILVEQMRTPENPSPTGQQQQASGNNTTSRTENSTATRNERANAGGVTSAVNASSPNITAITDVGGTAGITEGTTGVTTGAATDDMETASSSSVAGAVNTGGSSTSTSQVEDPVDDPMTASTTPPANPLAGLFNDSNDPENQQMQMARLIQAVVNSAADAELQIQINTPHILAHMQPLREVIAGTPLAAMLDQSGANVTAATTTVATATTSTSSSTDTEPQVSVNTNTLPTTSTQTRSTSRPQIQVGANNNWNGRLLPTNTAFDRFLPCNSHHIREPEGANARGASNGQRQAVNTTVHTTENTRIMISRSLRGSNTRLFIPMRRRQNRSAGTSASSLTNQAASNGSSGSSNTGRGRRIISLNNRNNSAGGPTSSTSSTGANSGTRHIRRINLSDLLTNLTNQATVRPIVPRINRSTQSTQSANATTMTDSPPAAPTPSSTAPPNIRRDVPTRTNTLRTQLRNFINETIFEGAPINEETIPTAINRALTWFGESLLFLPQYEKPEYNSLDSMCNILRCTMNLIIELFIEEGIETNIHFEHRLKMICEQFRTRLYSVLFVCVGPTHAAVYWKQLMRLLCVMLESNFRNEALQFLCIYLSPAVPAKCDTADAQQFVVLRNNVMDTDVEMAEIATTSYTGLDNPLIVEEEETVELPNVVPGSEPWHRSFPPDWLPVITRDLQTNPEVATSIQPPYSDAYLSGMSAKRRKILQTNKPPTNVEALVADNVRIAIINSEVNTPGSSSTNEPRNADSITGSISHDAVLQTSYTEAIRANVRERLKKNPDYKAEKYPEIAKFVNNK